MKKSKPIFLFYVLLAYVLLQFAWWSYLLLEQNQEIYRLKTAINLFEHHDPQFVVEKGNELEKKLHARRMMITGEGIVFFILLFIGFIIVKNSFRKETILADQQKNFLLSVTHELKSPIASIKLALETLFSREIVREKQKEIIGNAINDADRLNSLVENILLASKIETESFQLQRENINLSYLMEKSIKQAIHMFNPRQKIESSIEPDLFSNVDAFLFPSVFFNLFENAIKYSPENSIVKIILKKENNRIVLSVADEGSGIAEDEKKNIFNKFYRIGNEEIRKTKGTGLGLYIVKNITEKHNGKILVKDNIPRGTLFEVIL